MPTSLSSQVRIGMSNREPLKFKVCVLLDTFGSCPVVATIKVIELPVVLVGMTTTLSVFDPLAAKPPGKTVEG